MTTGVSGSLVKRMEQVLKQNKIGQPATREQHIEAAIDIHAATAALDLQTQVSQAGRTNVNVLHGVFDLKDYRIRSTQPGDADSSALSPCLPYVPEKVDAQEQLGFATTSAIGESGHC